MNIPAKMSDFDSDIIIDQLIHDYDEGAMPLPDIESEPHLLISKVRKHYMEYIIRLLTMNYESNQKLLNKNIYLPSAIWRCAKNIEARAARTCMVAQLYRKNIVTVIRELQNDTKKGKLNQKLYECLHRPPENEKTVQTTLNTSENCNCQCNCNSQKKRRKLSSNSIFQNLSDSFVPLLSSEDLSDFNEENKIAAINSHAEVDELPATEQEITELEDTTVSVEQTSAAPGNLFNIQSFLDTDNQSIFDFPPINSVRMSVESQDSDDVMTQLERLFHDDPNDDDLFNGALYTTDSSICFDSNIKKVQNENSASSDVQIHKQDILIENHSAQIKSLDERLESITGLLLSTSDNCVPQQKDETPKNKKPLVSKWLCEEHFHKSRLFELLDKVGDKNRKKILRVKEMLLELFGEDSDEEGTVSPFHESPEFITSCRERLAPWVVKLLTPHYIKGRIRGKGLFKALARHLIRLVYQCSHYPHKHEVQSFVTDFLQNHQLIRCEADFKQFRIDNV